MEIKLLLQHNIVTQHCYKKFFLHKIATLDCCYRKMLCKIAIANCCLSLHSKLQSEVKFIRLKGVIKPGQDAAKSCARCRTPFGWFFNKGTICPQCQHRVCETCRVPLDQPGKWLCVLCHKQM